MSLLEELINEPSGIDQYLAMAPMLGVNTPSELSGGMPSGPVRGGPQGWLNEAMRITNTAPKWRDELYDLMMRESGGDPRAYNDTAVASGEHAQGLFQTIPSTFEAHNLPRLGGINDPVANAVAAIRYIMGRYGNPGNLPASGGY